MRKLAVLNKSSLVNPKIISTIGVYNCLIYGIFVELLNYNINFNKLIKTFENVRC